MDFVEMVQKTINVEAKAGLRSSTMVRDLDACCLKGHHPSQNTFSKVQTQGSSYKDLFRSKEPKNTDPKLAPPRGNAAELAKKEDKNTRLWKCRQEQNKQTPITSDNTKASKKKKKRRDLSKVTCFNCDKKNHYASDCTKSPKNSYRSRQPRCQWPMGLRKLLLESPASTTRFNSRKAKSR